MYKVITITIEDEHSEVQTYVTLNSVKAAQILKGDDSGVVCLCIQPDSAQKIAALLNADHEQNETAS
ncbi:hypothetical protein [Pseudochrobactrum asaccharolyticum]|uniref:Uncharacterized protein n=1 Tax=Pseudochrobactrum asaccharolyticum TaxID=354351 RepID=A0A366DK52_9HYPH|nr:hypothetical protein [Pseudochrobactrum asaccharolyticum]RBO90450.1 hypothetical protein DFR47_11311 [Pseudochrobactrum asaccharolyticum]